MKSTSATPGVFTSSRKASTLPYNPPLVVGVATLLGRLGLAGMSLMVSAESNLLAYYSLRLIMSVSGHSTTSAVMTESSSASKKASA